ncbi:MAG: type IX secretion system sortase PorU, partial [Bacteroidales bacterium]|nr:type IX secretion system sortase PorU [Bacteroidales bacterium]
KGIYKLTYEQLTEMGFSNFNNIGVFGYGYMLPKVNSDSFYDDLPERNIIKVDVNNDGAFNAGDYLLFYAEGPDKIWYDKNAHVYKHENHDYSQYAYYFVSDQGTWRGATNVTSELFYDVEVDTYDNIEVLEKDSVNLMNMGRRWFWTHFDFYTTHNFSANFPDLIVTEPVKFSINLVARSTVNSSFNIYINNVLNNNLIIDNVSGGSNGIYAKERTADFQVLSNSKNINIKLDYNKTTSVSEGWLDYIRIIARCKLKMNSDFLAFSDSKSIANATVARFKILNTKSNTRVWDVSDPINALNINVSNSANETKFNRSVSELKEYIAFNVNSSHPSPIIDDYDLGMVKNQNLHALPNVDYVIITYPEFKAQAEQLAKLHEKNSGLSTVVVELDKIYNEFSSGCPDVSAIRNFMRMFYERANNDAEIPANLLLFGDGSFDNKAPMGKNGNYIITYQAYNSFSPSGAYVNDDFYVMLDPAEGLMSKYDDMDIGVGRIPVKTTFEAQTVVNKINAYMSNSHFGSWRNIVCFVADDADDSVIHQEQSKTLGDKVMNLHPNFNVDRIFLDAYERVSTVMGMRYPEVNKIIDDRINSGCLLFNYTGHGNTKTLAHEIVVDLSQVNSWSNINSLPIFVTATCEYARYDDYKLVSAGEQVLLNPNGGGIALFTTTRLAQAHSNHTLNMALLDYFFMRDANHKALSMGHILMGAKNLIGNDANKNVFALLGDPALRPAIPQYDIVTESINGINVNEFVDTLGAKGKVVVKGYVRDNLGNKMTDFNGLVFPTVYDKKMDYVTRGNSGKPPLDYTEQMNVLFRGQTSVKNGEFEFSFIVPVDIAYFYGSGKISYYAHNYITDANGHNFDMTIGGTSDNPVVDDEGPEIQLFMNNDEFIAGGITDENPILLAYVSD